MAALIGEGGVAKLGEPRGVGANDFLSPTGVISPARISTEARGFSREIYSSHMRFPGEPSQKALLLPPAS